MVQRQSCYTSVFAASVDLLLSGSTYTKIATGNSGLCPHIVFMRTTMRLILERSPMARLPCG